MTIKVAKGQIDDGTISQNVTLGVCRSKEFLGIYMIYTMFKLLTIYMQTNQDVHRSGARKLKLLII